MAIITEVPDETCGWGFDLSCCDWVLADPDADPPVEASPPQAVQQRAMNLAVQTLRMLTAGRVGGCPVTVRPCARNCGCGAGGFNPHISASGAWVNSCGHGHGCSCGAVSRIELPGPVGRVDEVLLDGAPLTEGADFLVYDDGLIRVGGSWPTCQNLGVPLGEPGTLAVTYLNAYVPDYGGAVAAGLLACEFAKACQGDKNCRLPRGTRSVTRQGISIELAADAFENGLTGIREVDSWVKAWNPNGLKQAPAIYSPDMPRPAYQTGL